MQFQTAGFLEVGAVAPSSAVTQVQGVPRNTLIKVADLQAQDCSWASKIRSGSALIMSSAPSVLMGVIGDGV